MSGDLPVRENKFVEQWGHMRENLEYKFRWTPKTIRTVLLAGAIFPVLVYRMTVKEFVRAKRGPFVKQWDKARNDRSD